MVEDKTELVNQAPFTDEDCKPTSPGPSVHDDEDCGLCGDKISEVEKNLETALDRIQSDMPFDGLVVFNALEDALELYDDAIGQHHSEMEFVRQHHRENHKNPREWDEDCHICYREWLAMGGSEIESGDGNGD